MAFTSLVTPTRAPACRDLTAPLVNPLNYAAQPKSIVLREPRNCRVSSILYSRDPYRSCNEKNYLKSGVSLSVSMMSFSPVFVLISMCKLLTCSPMIDSIMPSISGRAFSMS